MLSLSAIGLSSVHSLSVCRNDEDCNLNGFCVEGQCQCVLFWTGLTCESLSTSHVDSHTRGALIPIDDTSRWCASAIQDDGTGTWHLFSSVMVNHCGLNSWQSNSAISHATSTSVEGPYQEESIIHPYFSHNPKVVRAPDGTYLVYHIGCGDEAYPARTDCSNGTTPVSSSTTEIK